MQARTPDRTGYAVPSRIWKLQVLGAVRFNVILREFVDSVAEVAR